MTKICVTSARTGNIVYIPIDIIEELAPATAGTTMVYRTGKPELRVRESMREVQQMVERLRPVPRPTQQVQQPVNHRTEVYSVNVQQPRRNNRAENIVDTAVGVGAAIVGAEIVGEVFDNIFNTDWF
jgi:hypothetical protein